MTTGKRALLLHGTRIWTQMIDEMFWPFAMKVISERLNSLHINQNVRTPEYILYGVNVEEILVK